MSKIISIVSMLLALVVAYLLDRGTIALRVQTATTFELTPWVLGAIASGLILISMLYLLFWLVVFNYPRSFLVSIVYILAGLISPLYIIAVIVLEESAADFLTSAIFLPFQQALLVKGPDAYLLLSSSGILVIGIAALIWGEPPMFMEESEVPLAEVQEEEAEVSAEETAQV